MASSRIEVEVSFTRESLRALERVAEKTRALEPPAEYEPVEMRVHDGIWTMYVDNVGKSHMVASGEIHDVEGAGWRKVWVRKG